MIKPRQIEKIGSNIEDLIKDYTLLKKTVLQKHHLSASAISIFELLLDETLTLKNLTDKSLLDKSTLSRQVNPLVKNGWVIKERRKDKRYTYFTLSEEAATLYQNFKKDLNKELYHSLKTWSEEEVQLVYVLLGRLDRSIHYTVNSQEK
ncbi:MarR family winged helix-turn-helix transcriptional regulator [Lacticigenium naphthae]|uniref:MarR family winged helix-turn-helix transcriptional regulator n=1 Tax=Lacticigenium naphthae TaxID=515351 RepID=UPI000414D2FF|nr:MarR family transcriptional regulator [Lacticigenium naphthae]